MCDTSKIERFKKISFERKLISVLKKYGTPRSHFQEFTTDFADRKPEKGEEYYYYVGPDDEKTRPFCKLMLKIDKVFSLEEINKISDELNYPVLKYKGSYNCRHEWVRFRGARIFTPKPTVREIRKLINKGVES